MAPSCPDAAGHAPGPTFKLTCNILLNTPRRGPLAPLYTTTHTHTAPQSTERREPAATPLRGTNTRLEASLDFKVSDGSAKIFASERFSPG